MSVQELELAVSQLSREELSQFAQWFDEFRAALWDKQIARDVKAGRLDAVLGQAKREFEAGLCREI